MISVGSRQTELVLKSFFFFLACLKRVGLGIFTCEPMKNSPVCLGFGFSPLSLSAL